MRSCEAYEEWISAFLDGELSGADQAELMEHMAACPECQRYFDDLVAMHEAAMAYEEASVPDGFAERIMDQVRITKQDKAETPKVIRFPQWRRWTAMAACCAVVLLGVWSLQGRNGMDMAESQAWVTADDAPRMSREADMSAVTAAMDDAGDGIMVMMDENQPADNSLSRMADDVSGSGIYEAEDTDVEEKNAVPIEDSQEAAKDEPEPSPMAPAGDAVGGTLTAGGDVVRQWVEDELGLDWESGQAYALTVEQYDNLVDVLTEAGVEFRVEAADSCWLIAE